MPEKLKPNTSNRRWIVLIVGIVLVCLAVFVLIGLLLGKNLLPPLFGPKTTTPVPIPIATGTAVPETTGQFGISPRLSEGVVGEQPYEPLPVATGEPLTAKEVEAILARLPAMPLDTGDQTDFKLPTEILPPPRPGETINDAFPAPEAALTPELDPTGPLEILRYAPEGEIPIAPFVSITFSQPMVPLATLEDLAALDVPVRIEPDLAGTWRWLGTKTLTFEYDSEWFDRLPKATEYRVTIPAGTESATGGKLLKAVTWTFSTPAPRVTISWPANNYPQPLEPIYFVGFDQRIDPAAVLETIHVTADGDSVQVVLATEAELEEDEQVSRLVEQSTEGRWLAFRAIEPLPRDADIQVLIGPGTPSAEGPLKTIDTQSYAFRTYAPLRIEEHGCSWYDTNCPPLTPLFIRFNNPIDAEAYTDSMVRIEPAIPGMLVNLYDNMLTIEGQTKGQTTYTVIVDGRIQDAFGQTLGKDARLTFRVDKAEPVLTAPQATLVTLDPAGAKPVFSVYAMNYGSVNLRIYRVQPTDWPSFLTYLREWQRTDNPPSLPGTLVLEKSLRLDLAADELTQVDIGLNDYLQGSSGQFVVVVEPPKGIFDSEDDRWRRFRQTIIRWIQVTQIAVDAFNDQNEMVVWTTALTDGKPLAGVAVLPEGRGPGANTGTDGIASFAIPPGTGFLVARKGDDQAILPRSADGWYDYEWNPQSITDTLAWYVFDDRKMYQPGEEMHLKGWVRRIGSGPTGDVGLPGSSVNNLSYAVTDPQGNSLGSGSAEINELGGFDFAFTVPEQTNLGSAHIMLSVPEGAGGMYGLSYSHEFQIQEFRRPEFEVTAQSETEGPFFAGGYAILGVTAQYYAGGALPGAETTWQVTSTPGTYAPPNWPDFTFGTWTPWWWFYGEYGGGMENGVTETFSGTTDGQGVHRLRIDFDPSGEPGNDPRPFSIAAEATVMDVNRQAWSSTTTLLVHPADVYVGLRSERYFVERGTPLPVDVIVTDLDGKPASDRKVEVQAARMEWKVRGGDWTEEAADVQTCNLVSTIEPLTCTFETAIGGRYQITAKVTDALGRSNQSRIIRWVSGGQLPPSRKVEREEATLIPDQQTYQPGDTAHILVQSPFSPAEGLLTVSRSGILYTKRFQLPDGEITLDIPIEEAQIPNIHIKVDLTGSAPRTDDLGNVLSGIPERPAYATGSLDLSIPPLERTLSLEVTPAVQKLEPGGETTLTLTVKDADGRPVADAELAVVVVDEAILALTQYDLKDPIGVFYVDRPSMVDSAYGRASIILVDPQALANAAAEQSLMNMGRGGGGDELAATMMPGMAMPAAPMEMDAAKSAEEGGGAIQMRSDFNPLAAFVPAVRTDSQGRASVPIHLPDNLTRYRVMVVAVDGGGRKFGTGESNITARLPLMVRPSAPRFLNFGDKVELPIVLQNQTDAPMTVEVAVRAGNLKLAGGSGSGGLRVVVPANERVEVRFPADTDMAGTARLQIAAVAGDAADAAAVELPVYTPATTEAFATYGVIDQGAVAQPVLAPTGVFPQYGGLEIGTSSTALQALTDAVLYLQAYPFECTEQLASRILSVAALRDVLTAFQADGLPSPQEMEAAVARDILRLQSLQNYDGGFPYWRRGFDSIPFNTIHAAHALIRAREKGFEVPEAFLGSALDYLREIESHYPYWYTAETRRTLSAYALFVRDLAGERDPIKAANLLDEAPLEEWPLEALGWLWPVIDDSGRLESIRRHVNNHAVETAGAANFTTGYTDQTYLLLSSDRRTDAILLNAIIGDNPQSDLIPKVVNGLLAHRTRGRWGNTQENVFVLLALDRYFNAYESQTPDFVARIWLGDTYAGSAEFQGYTTDRHETVIPMSYVISETAAGGGSADLILSKEGAGRLYYRLGLRYAPDDLRMEPLDMGFVVRRVYEAVDDPQDVSRDADGVWHFRAGARVRVRIDLVAVNRRYHVALVDPLPAGLEIINPALAVSQSVPQDPNSTEYRYGWWWWGTWYEHQNLRDERVEAFTSLLWDGVYNYTYVARATTPGVFTVPPAKAEEMYSPDVFGRSASDRVIIK